jgi:hypothetical protein
LVSKVSMIIGSYFETITKKERKQLNGSKKLIQILLLINYNNEKTNSNTARA